MKYVASNVVALVAMVTNVVAMVSSVVTMVTYCLDSSPVHVVAISPLMQQNQFLTGGTFM